MQDSDGNSIQVQYGPAVGTTVANTSGRITQITDARAPGANASYSFSYAYLNSADAFPHLTRIFSGANPAENYWFSYGYNLALASPFAMTAFGAATELQTVTASINGSGVNSSSMQYGLGTGELTQVTTPLSGTLAWGYRTYTYTARGVSYREVQTRQVSPAAGATYSWNLTLDNNPTLHAAAAVAELGAGASKMGSLGTGGGFFGAGPPS